MKTSRSLLIAPVIAALSLGACDDDDNAGGSSAGAGSASLELTETEYAINPGTGNVEGGGKVTISVMNDGQETHALEVQGGDIEEETDDIAPGESATLEVELPLGTYELSCPIGDHKDKGMTGSLQVGGASDSSPGSSNSSDGSMEDDSGY